MHLEKMRWRGPKARWFITDSCLHVLARQVTSNTHPTNQPTNSHTYTSPTNIPTLQWHVSLEQEQLQSLVCSMVKQLMMCPMEEEMTVESPMTRIMMIMTMIGSFYLAIKFHYHGIITWCWWFVPSGVCIFIGVLRTYTCFSFDRSLYRTITTNKSEERDTRFALDDARSGNWMSWSLSIRTNHSRLSMPSDQHKICLMQAKGTSRGSKLSRDQCYQGRRQSWLARAFVMTRALSISK